MLWRSCPRASGAMTVSMLRGERGFQKKEIDKLLDWLKSLRAADPGLNTLVDAYSVHPYPDPRTAGPYEDRPDARQDGERDRPAREELLRLHPATRPAGQSRLNSAPSAVSCAEVQPR